MSGVGSGDRLARGANSAQFEGPKVSQEKWNEMFPDTGEETEIERLRRKRLVAEPVEDTSIIEEEAKKEVEKIREVQEAQQAAKQIPTSVPFRAIQDRVVVFRVESTDEKPLIETPDDAKEKPSEGIVLAVGPGKYTSAGVLIPTTVKEQDHVLFGKYAGQEVKVGLVTFLILREEDIFLVRT